MSLRKCLERYCQRMSRDTTLRESIHRLALQLGDLREFSLSGNDREPPRIIKNVWYAIIVFFYAAIKIFIADLLVLHCISIYLISYDKIQFYYFFLIIAIGFFFFFPSFAR